MAEQTEVPAAGTAVTASVVVCAYTLDRWERLEAAVRGAASQRRSGERSDEVVLVIDHNDALLKRAKDELGDVALVVENDHKKGLCGARNAGVDASQGDVVVFLDDDALPGDVWLAAILRPFDEDERVMISGGPVRPIWEAGQRPGWFPEEFDWVVACSYRGQFPEDRSGTVDVRNPFGCNMAYRRQVFEEVGGFREDIGRVGNYPLGGDETELCIRLRQTQPEARIVLALDAVVDHHVPAARHRFRYFLKRCVAEGITKVLVTEHVGRDDGLSSERPYITRTLPRGIAREMRSTLSGSGRAGGSRWDGPRRSGAMVSGVLFAGLGYARGRMARAMGQSGKALGRETKGSHV